MKTGRGGFALWNTEKCFFNPAETECVYESMFFLSFN